MCRVQHELMYIIEYAHNELICNLGRFCILRDILKQSNMTGPMEMEWQLLCPLYDIDLWPQP